MMKSKSRLTILALVFLLASACSGVMDSKRGTRQTYLLTPDPSVAGAAAPAPAPVLALTLSVVPGLDTDQILALSPDARLSPYANARWPDHLPEVITSTMKRSLTASGRFSSVEESSHPGDGAWSVRLELQQFYGIQNSTGETSSVRVEMAGKLECNGKSMPLRLSESSSVSEERLSAVVAAHQRGLNGVTRQLLEQVGSTCP